MDSPVSLFPILYCIGLFIRSKNKKAGAIYDLVWSAGLLIFAITVIADGGQLALFNWELPNTVIVLIIIAIMASEVFTLIGVCIEPMDEEKREELSNAPLPEGVEPIEDNGSAKITLIRESKFAGSGTAIPIMLNDVYYGDIGNGKTVTIVTRRKHNKVSLLYGVKSPVVEFDAENGEEYTIRISAGISNATMTVENKAIEKNT